MPWYSSLITGSRIRVYYVIQPLALRSGPLYVINPPQSEILPVLSIRLNDAVLQ